MDIASAHNGMQKNKRPSKKTKDPENMVTLRDDNIPSTSSGIINLHHRTLLHAQHAVAVSPWATLQNMLMPEQTQDGEILRRTSTIISN